MKKLIPCLTAAAGMLSAGIAFAACTQEELQTKVMALSTQIQALAQKDPATFQRVVQDFKQKSVDLHQTADLDVLCRYYDEMIEATK